MLVPFLEFKSVDSAQEFERALDPRLRAFHYDISEYAWRKFKKHWIITEVNRTRPENETYGVVKNTQHFYGQAVDSRSFHFTKEEKKLLTEYANSVWGADFINFSVHTKGTAEHFHCAIRPEHTRGDYSSGKANI